VQNTTLHVVRGEDGVGTIYLSETCHELEGRKMKRRPNLLPQPWTTKPISSVAEVNPRTTLPSKDFDDIEVPLYDMGSIDEYTGSLREPAFVRLANCRSGKTKFQNKDVLFAKITPCVQNGKSALVTGIPSDLAFGSSEFYVLRPKKDLLPEFLFYFIRQRRIIRAAVDSFTGTSGRQRVPKTFWDTVSIPVPRAHRRDSSKG